MRVFIYILFSLFALASCQKFVWNNPYDTATPKSIFTPDGLAVRQEGENLLLSWSQDNNNISGFKLFRSIDRGVSTELVALNKSTLSYTDANIQGGKTYTYTLKAYADKNESNEVSTEIVAKSRPTINTIAASAITENTATSGGAIVSDGGSPITSKGLVWSTSVNPTIDLTTKTNNGSGSGAFERILTNLSPNTIYYVRAYATNGVGTAYGNQVTFTTSKPPAPPILESLTQGLVAYYPFSGNANDSTSNSNNGNVNSGVSLTTDRFNLANRAYSFNGGTIVVSHRTYLSINQNNKIFSISLWVNKSGNQNPVHIIGKRAAGAHEFNWQIFQHTTPGGAPGGGFGFTGVVNSSSLGIDYTGVSDPVLENNKWEHLVGIFDNGKWILYKNGVMVAQRINSLFPSDNGSPALEIGNCGGWGAFFGKLDDIRIYNRALTQEEITYLANN